jgi:hypothetical protein
MQQIKKNWLKMDTLSKSQYVGLVEFKKINENLDYQPKFKWSVNID